MVQVRKLVLAIAAASALSSGMAQALQLGEMTLKSKLNQPLSVEIELLDVGGLTASDIVPSLASSQAFVDAGVDRQAFLDELTFTPVLNSSGRSVVRVTSSKPLPDSYVRFLLQVQWPNGRLMRDYSVLLDPAKFEQKAPQASAPAPRLATPAATSVSKAAEHTTTSRDTLWEIAAKNRNGGSIQQTMLAIQALNPGAFVDGNINRMKTGQVLRLPDPVQSTSLPQPQAIAEVTAQNAAWRQGRRGATNQAAGRQQLDATKRTQAGAAPSQTAAKDNLSLVSAEAAKAGVKGAAGDSKALSNKLAVTQESLDSTRRENEELKSRMTDLQSQLDKLQRLIELKNNQLAKLQAEGGTPAQPAVMPAELAAVPATPAAPAAEAPVVAPVEKPAEPAEAASTEGKFNELLTNPIVLGVIGGAAGLLVLLLLLLWARHRNARLEEEKHLRMARALAEEPEFSSNLEQDMPSDSFEGLEVPAANVTLAPAPAPAPAPVAVAPVVAPATSMAPPSKPIIEPGSADALAQAQSHLDRGHLNQAAAVLEEAIKLEPKRSDLRLKLLEVYGQQGDKDGFVSQERQLVANGENHAQVELLKNRYPAMAVLAAGVSAAVAAAALDAQYVKDLLQEEPAPAAAPQTDTFDTDFDLSLDDLEAASPAVVAPEVDDLSFESVLQQQTETKASEDDLADFDLDLQLDAPASQSDDDFLSGLEEQMKDLPPVEPPILTPAALDDFDLPEDFDLSLADEPAPADKPDAFASELDDVNAELERLSQSLESPSIEPSFTAEDAAKGDDEPEFDFLSGTDEVATKLDLAQAYIDMGDADGARDILSEVLTEGDEKQRGEAKEMLSNLA
ncbi:twitching motility protein FimV [Pseudomonas sp. FH4]|jgi:pilus assembly protein FimV|uniref:FimV/HubP family polar landmark protein n=1 Tax=Pseudomonas fluorescens group TaxID=136843 RepID=UPI0003DD6662|nr:MULTISPECIES: FimV/HubP family polar landmark protein [Pseudomonas fluorescens group]ETK19203.1 twitching motility protein FimV [Pseudomonas sp. FH4]MBF8008041.1 FimV family protein [Pseudomonas brenneri]